jgi:hypothetical protein
VFNAIKHIQMRVCLTAVLPVVVFLTTIVHRNFIPAWWILPNQGCGATAMLLVYLIMHQFHTWGKD